MKKLVKPGGSVLTLIRVLLFTALACASATQAADLPDTKGPLTLGTVDGESNESASFVNIRFNRDPDFEAVAVSTHGSFIQIDLPGTLVPNPGEFVEGNSPFIKKIAVFQLTNKDGAVRLFVAKNAATVHKSMRAEVLGNRILVTIDHKALDDLLASVQPGSASTESPGVEKEATNAPVAAATKTITPADVMHGKATAEEAGFATGGIDFRDKLVKIAAFIGALLFIATLLMMLRPLFKRHSRRKGKSGKTSEAEFGMSTIASMSLAPKQKLSLIQVGNEKILLAIGPESVTYIATIGANTQPHLAMAAAMQQALALPTFSGNQHFAPTSAQTYGTPPLAPKPDRPRHPKPAERLRTGSETSERQAAFDSALAAADPNASHIKLKEQPTAGFAKHDEKLSKTSSKVKKKPEQQAQPKRSGGRVNIAINDDGVTDLSAKSFGKESARSADPRTIDDVTQLIRQKLQAFKSL